MSAKYNFFGRREYLAILEKRIRDLKDGYRQNIAVIGEEFVGKSSIIFHFLKKYWDNQTILLYLEARIEPLNNFARRFIGVLLYSFLSNSGLPLREDLDFLTQKSSKYIPKTIAQAKLILASLEKRKKNNVFTDLLSLCQSIHEETGKFCVVIIDEFHNLESLELKNLYSDWARLLMLQKNTMYIIISSLCFKTKAVLSKNLSLLFGNFEVVTVEPFDIGISEAYLEYKIGSLGLEKSKKDFIINFTGGYPFYLEVACEAILNSKDLDLRRLLEKLIFEPSGILNQRFSNYLKRFQGLPHSQDYLSILYLIADGHNKIKDITCILKRTLKELNIRLAYLLESDALTKSGEFLRINDRVFAFWLKFTHQGKTHSLTFDAGSQREFFRANIDKMLADFMRDIHRPVIERVSEVLRLFENEVIQIERKRFKLDNFREVKPVDFEAKNIREGLIGRSQDALWIIAFKYEPLTERDVIEFSRECRKYRSKSQKKIILALCDIDANARLRALEDKIMAWDLNSLNQILGLFSKPMIIL